MQILIGNTVLCAGQARNSTGSPVGPEGFSISEALGVAERNFCGAARVKPEHVLPDMGTCSFTVTRTYATVEAALAYACTGHFAEETEGAFTIGGTTVFANAAVKSRVVSHVGCTVKVAYTVEG